ncbi:MAG: relaxase/mobilization nuclease domain-containing protein [Salinivirgaceae bacterium]|nr:relaxase/mobilization nuclease domain-containing protein [Salinivirgaceae bacterium]
MIPKITSGKTFGGLVGYNEKKVAMGTAELIGIENIPSPNVIKETLEQVASFNPLCLKSTFHVSLSFPPNERTLDNATLQAIANEFMEGMGYRDNPYAIYRHYDTDNQHIHIVSTRIDWHGKRISDFQERRKAGKLATEIERKYGLIVVERNKKSKKETQARRIKPGPADKANARQHIINAIASCLEMKNITSIGNFVERLKDYSVGMRISEKKAVCYFIVDENGRQATPAVSASAIPFKPTYRRLGNVIGRNKKLITLRRNELKRKFNWLHNYSVVRQTTFDNFLKENQLQILYVKNAGGIYGVKILDTKNNVEYKGSDLGVSWTQLRTQLSQKITVKKGDELEFIQNTYAIFLNSNKKYKESQLLANENIKLLLCKTVENATNTYYAESVKALIDNFIDEKIKTLPEIKEKEKMPTEPRLKGHSRHFSDKITQAITEASSAHHGNLFDFKSPQNAPKGVIREDDDDEDLKTRIKILLGKLIK